VQIRTLAEGDISELQIGVMGTMNALQLQEIRRKTRRGLEGVAREGRHTGGKVYGYRIHREEDASGERIRGLRTIDPAQAEVVLEIYRHYSAGSSPRAIANLLNARGLPGPRGADATPPPSTATPNAATVSFTMNSIAASGCSAAKHG